MLNSIKNITRKHFKIFNKFENRILTKNFQEKCMQIKETNSQIVWETYYIPKAISAVLKEQNYLTTSDSVSDRAKAMLLADMANGVIDEFYRFKNK